MHMALASDCWLLTAMMGPLQVPCLLPQDLTQKPSRELRDRLRELRVDCSWCLERKELLGLAKQAQQVGGGWGGQGSPA